MKTMAGSTKMFWTGSSLSKECLISCSFLCFLGPDLTADQPMPKFNTFSPTFEIQAAIDRVIHTETEDQFLRDLETLRKLGGRNIQSLIPDLVYYSMKGDDVKEGMAAGILFKHLDIDDHDIVHALVPYLSSEDMEFRKQVKNILGGIEAATSGRPPDYSYYRGIIANAIRKGNEPPHGLVQHMYERAPGVAALSMMREYLRATPVADSKEIMWAEHTVKNAIWMKENAFQEEFRQALPGAMEQLGKLARRDEWWMRLYVVHIIRQHPQFRTQEMADRLKQDEHELVRRAINPAEKNAE